MLEKFYHNNIPVTVYKNKKLFEAMVAYKKGKNWKKIAEQLNIDTHESWKMLQFLKKNGEI